MPRSVLLQRTLGVLIAVALAVCAVIAARRPVAVRVPEAGGTVSSAPSTTPTVVTETLPGPAAAAVATTGPGLTEPGVHVVAQPASDGSLEVVEHVKVSTPVSSLPIAMPHTTSSGLAGATPSITGFQAQADGLVVTDMPASPLTTAGDRLQLPSAASEISMRYRLEGGLDRSQPAPVGRVLMILPPITATDPSLGDPAVVVEVVGANVRNLVCPNLPVSDQLCGRQNGRVWSTTAIPLSRSVVVAQVDLPQPGER